MPVARAAAYAHLASMSDQIPYSVRRSSRARRVRVHVTNEAAVEVVLPSRAPQRAAAAAISELRPWIERRLAEARSTLALMPARDGTLPYLDARLQLVPQAGRRRVHRRGAQLLIPAREPRAAIERFYRRAARREVARRLDRASAIAGTPYRDLTIRSQRTRWASCSSHGRMSFNWRLLLAPERVLDYVVWHEVCHLAIADHSPRFWALLESHWPSWRAERDWLRRFGPTLVLP
jgi:predicted metal-dependent hydrolase